MRKRLALCAVLLAGMPLAGPALAAPTLVYGTFSVQLGELPTLATIVSGRARSSQYAWGATVAFRSGALAPTGTISETLTPPALNLSKITVGLFQNLAGTLPGTMGNDGVAHLFFTSGGPAGSVPLRYFGGGGTGMATFAGLPATVVGGVWTNLGVTSTRDVRTIMLADTAAGIPMTVTASAYDTRITLRTPTTDPSPRFVGRIQLVAPVSVRLFGGALGTVPAIGLLTLGLATAPEPGTLGLWGLGAVALGTLGRVRRGRGDAGRS